MERGEIAGRYAGSRAAAGSALMETLVSLPLLLLVTLGAVQWGLIFEAKSTLEYAALMAARAGSVAHADAGAIRNGLARGLLPLYSPPKNVPGAVRTMTTRVVPDIASHTRIRILNPTVEAFEDFAERGDSGVDEIPNLDLHRRPVTVGAASGVNIQDANLLKVEVLYGYELKVPLVGPMIASVARWWNRDPRARAMLAQRRMPILASALVRMQSEARQNELMVARDGSLPAGGLEGSGDPAGQGNSGGGDVAAGGSQAGEAGGAPGGGWSPVVPASMTDPYQASPRPGGSQDRSGGGDPGGDGSVPPITDDPGAGEYARCEAADSFAAVTPSQPAQQTGNPIHVVTGNKYQRETDLSALPGVLGLRFVRYYNSRVHRSGAMGFGWRHSFQVTLDFRSDHDIRLHQADGRTIRFRTDWRAEPREPTIKPNVTAVAYRQSRKSDPRAPAAAVLVAARIEDGTLERLPETGGYRWTWRSGRVLNFDRRGRLRTVQALGGATAYLTYGPDGRLVKVQDPQRRTLLFFYDAHDRLVRITDPGGVHTDYVYDAHNNLVAVQYGDGSKRQYHYEDSKDPHNLTGITDARGVRFATYAYDDQDRAVLSTHGGNVGKVTLRYQPESTLVTDSEGRTSTYHIHLKQGVPLVTRIDGPGCTPCDSADVRYTYNDRYQVTEKTTPDGIRIIYEYNAANRLESVYRVEAARREFQVGYRYRNRGAQLRAIILPSVAFDKKRKVEFQYNKNNQLLRVSDAGFAPTPDGGYVPIGRQIEYAYTTANRVDRIIGPGEDTKDRLRFEWDERGLLRKIRYAGGATLAVSEYDSYLRPTVIQIDTGPALRVKYDIYGNVRRLENERGSIDARWADRTLLTELRFSDTDAIPFKYDDARRLVDSGAGNTSGAARVATSSFGSRESNFDQSAAGFMQRVRHERGRVQLLDGNGNKTVFGVDDFGRVRYQTNPDRGTRQFQYDSAGRITSARDQSGAEVRYGYNDAGLLKSAHIDGHEYEIERDQRGRTIHGWGGSETTKRHGTRRISRWIKDQSGRSYQVDYQLDAHRRLIRKRLPTGANLYYRYRSKDAERGLEIWRDHAAGASSIVSVDTDDSGSAVLRFGNGLQERRINSESKLKTIDVKGILRWDYRYANRKIVSINANGSPHHRYRYDADGRLTFALTPELLLGYRYDANGNRLEKVVNGSHTAYSYSPGSNRIRAADISGTRIPVHYDPNGAVSRVGPYQLEYNGNGQPIAVYRDGQLLARYGYNGNAERIYKTVYDKAGKAHAKGFLYEQGRLLAETGSSGAVVREYIYLGRRPVAVLENNQVFYVHTNHLDAPVAVTDLRKRVIWRADYLPFGSATVDEDPDGDGIPFVLQLRLPGQYEDSETGLYYNYFRYYDPHAGRYLSPDPMGWAAGSNPYLYAAADPVQYVDPQGLLLFAFDGTGNTDDPGRLAEKNATITNVVRFRESYVAPIGEPETPLGGNYYYVTGAGEGDRYFGHANWLDEASGFSVPTRTYFLVNRLFQYLEHIQSLGVAGQTIDIDVVGFSRGAASARIFVNAVNDIIHLSENTKSASWDKRDTEPLAYLYRALKGRWSNLGDDQVYRYAQLSPFLVPDYDHALGWVAERFQYLQDYCVHLNLRFLGLFDTVPHYGVAQANDIQQLALGIPPGVDHVAHAVALNEYRAAFDGVSIHESPQTKNSATRVEQGFIGAHSDIGGGYGEGDLNHVTFMWLVNQSLRAGVAVNDKLISAKFWDIVVNPILHDSVGVSPKRGTKFLGPDRKYRYLNGAEEMQKEWSGVGMSQEETDRLHDLQFMERAPCYSLLRWPECGVKGLDMAGDRSKVGAVSIAYSAWLKEHYGLDISIDHSQLDWERRASQASPAP